MDMGTTDKSMNMDMNMDMTSSSSETMDMNMDMTSSSSETMDMNMDMTSSSSETMDMNMDMTSSTSEMMDMATKMTSETGMAAMTGMTGMSMDMDNMSSSTGTMKMNPSKTMSGMAHMSGMNMETTGMTGMSMTGMTGMTAMTGMATMSSMTGMAAMSGMSGMGSMATMSGMGGMGGMSNMTMSSSMAMSGMKMSCTMSMLWNWYSKDVCFISKQWKTSTPALFGGTCVGVWALLITINWWRRVIYEYKINCGELRKREVESVIKQGGSINNVSGFFENHDFNNTTLTTDFFAPLAEVWKHKWYWALNKNLSVQRGDKIYVYPSIWEHLLHTVADTIEWSVHHVVMLLFMYFNGYVFISCMIGAGCGFLLFQYKNINLAKRGDNISKRCCL